MRYALRLGLGQALRLGMLFKTFSASVFGIDAYLVEVEADVSSSYQGSFDVVGLPDIAVKESRERIKSALRNCGFGRYSTGFTFTSKCQP